MHILHTPNCMEGSRARSETPEEPHAMRGLVRPSGVERPCLTADVRPGFELSWDLQSKAGDGQIAGNRFYTNEMLPRRKRESGR